MTPARYTKCYASPEHCRAAVRHYTWLTQYATPFRLPPLRAIGRSHLVFDFIDGRHAQPADLPALAAHLGDVHAAAWVNDLHRARLDTPHEVGGKLVMPDYLTARQQALIARHEAGFLPTRAALTAAQALLARTVSGPVAFYKDANPRNFLIATDTIVTLDVDDLTLAPFGYDLAKLIVTLSMTYGNPPVTVARLALDRYNQAAVEYHDSLGCTDIDHLADLMALHRILTAPYLGRNGYQHEFSMHSNTFHQTY